MTSQASRIVTRALSAASLTRQDAGVRSHAASSSLIPAGEPAQQCSGALLVAGGSFRPDTSHRPFGLPGLAFQISTERGPGRMAMLSRNRALDTGQAQLTGQLSERVLQDGQSPRPVRHEPHGAASLRPSDGAQPARRQAACDGLPVVLTWRRTAARPRGLVATSLAELSDDRNRALTDAASASKDLELLERPTPPFSGAPGPLRRLEQVRHDHLNHAAGFPANADGGSRPDRHDDADSPVVRPRDPIADREIRIRHTASLT